jgi:phospholipid transport system transporter-binding protein
MSIALSGLLNDVTATQLFLQQSPTIIADPAALIQIDLAGVTRSDSAGVALMIAWTRLARRQRKTIRFLRVPKQMRAIIRVSGLENILSIAEEA